MGTCMAIVDKKAIVQPSSGTPTGHSLDTAQYGEMKKELSGSVLSHRESYIKSLIRDEDCDSLQAYFSKQIELFEIPKHKVDSE